MKMKLLQKLGLNAGKRTAKKAASPLTRLGQALKKEARMRPVLHQEVVGALRRMQAARPGLEQELARAYGYAVFPRVAKANMVVGGAYGTGEVFERARLVGYAGLLQITIGVQAGGQTVNELVIFSDRGALEQFKASSGSFAASVSIAAVSAAAAVTKGNRGTRVLVHSEGGMMVEAAIGWQKFFFKPAVLGRLQSSGTIADASQAAKLGAPGPPPPR